jgi:hypothetical protein
MRLSAKQLDALMDCLLGLRDPRMRRGIRHGKVSILGISICAVLSGARSFTAIAEWGKRCTQSVLRRLGCRVSPRTQRYEAPSESTIRRLLQSIDAQSVDDALMGWLSSVVFDEPNAVALDGKTLRGARRSDGTQVHLLSAFLHGHGIPVAQQQVKDHSNEIPSAQPLLEPLDLADCVVTADALHTQKDPATFLVEDKKADYCLTVKDNQPTLKKDIDVLFREKTFPPSGPDRR